MEVFSNPFRPGAGQAPPYLAGRTTERGEFIKLLDQKPILRNAILTGLRGVGKTVLLETFRPVAIEKGWLWAGTDLSESVSISENNLATRILTDLASVTAPFTVLEKETTSIGFKPNLEKENITLNYSLLRSIYEETPGLVSDKLKHILELTWKLLKGRINGIVLAYDEAQMLKDHAQDKQFPLSVLLEVTQYVQRKEIPYLLVLTGLPTLYPNLVEARTYAERMFQTINLDRLSDKESTEAIMKPIEKENCPVRFTETAVGMIVENTGGYPYFIQFFCKEAYDSLLVQLMAKLTPSVTIEEIKTKLDNDFYSSRLSRITDRQKDLLKIICQLDSSSQEFTVQEIVQKSKDLGDAFKSSYVNQILAKLIDAGIVYKNRHGKYSFAVPLFDDYLKRSLILQ